MPSVNPVQTICAHISERLGQFPIDAVLENFLLLFHKKHHDAHANTGRSDNARRQVAKGLPLD